MPLTGFIPEVNAVFKQCFPKEMTTWLGTFAVSLLKASLGLPGDPPLYSYNVIACILK